MVAHFYAFAAEDAPFGINLHLVLPLGNVSVIGVENRAMPDAFVTADAVLLLYHDHLIHFPTPPPCILVKRIQNNNSSNLCKYL
jgi:hypothetical protein